MFGVTEEKHQPLRRPFKRPFGVNRARFFGARGLGMAGSDPFGFNSHLADIGRFNPLFVDPFIQHLMRQSVMPRIAMVLLGSAMSERQYVVEGASPELEGWYQRWLDAFLPQMLRFGPQAVWYGWQPLILDWGWTEGPGGRGRVLVPCDVHDLDPFEAQALEDSLGRFAGLSYNGEAFGPERGVALTWEGWSGNAYGTPQALTVYPYWWAHSVLLVWMMRYYERSVDPVRVGWARNESVPTGRNNADGSPQLLDLSEMVAACLDALGNGDSAMFPLPDDLEDAPYVKLDTLDLPDRADTWMKALAYMEQMMLLASLNLPGIGVSGSMASLDAGDAKTAERTQLRVLEYTTEMIVNTANSAVRWIHGVARFPGLPPRVRGASFKRDQEEKLTSLFKDAMQAPVAAADGDSYRPIDLVKWDRVARALNLPLNELSDVEGRWAKLMEAAPPAPGGRPPGAAINPDIPSGDEHGHESRPEERLDGKARAA